MTYNRHRDWIETDIERLKELAKQEALKQTAAERSAIAQQQQQLAQDLAFTHIFRTVVPGRGRLADNQANRNALVNLVHEDQFEVFSPEWFDDLVEENNPALNTLVWEQPLTSKERKAQEEKTAQVLQDLASDKIRRFNLADNEANRKAIMDHPNDDVVVLPDGPVILTDGEDPIIELVPASQEELAKRYRQHLIALKKNNDIAGLRAASEAERAERSQNVAQLHRDYSLLRGFATRQEYLLPPLPATWNGRPLDATRIKQGGRELISQIGRKHGFERINAVLYGLDESFFANWSQKLKEIEFQLYGIAGSAH